MHGLPVRGCQWALAGAPRPAPASANWHHYRTRRSIGFPGSV
jgi:hypothetical protein